MTSHKLIPQARLKFFFDRNGYLHFPDPVRQEQEGHTKYKKGHEVRLVAHDEVELEEIRGLLEQADFSVSKSYIKGHRFIQPIYGRQAVEHFRELIRQPLEPESTD